MIELERVSNGFLKSFDIKVAKRILKDAKRLPKVQLWRLPVDSDFKFSDGVIIRKAKKKDVEDKV